MAIPTSRTKERALIKIKDEICNGCGLCVFVCNDSCLFIENGKVGRAILPFLVVMVVAIAWQYVQKVQ